MNRWSGAGVLAVVLVFAAVALVVLRSTTSEVTVTPPVSMPSPGDDPAAAIVINRFESGGFSLFGLQFGSVNRTVTVQFYAEPGCYARVADGESWPPSTAGCETAAHVRGIVSGGGTTATGESIIAVDITVGADCYDAIQPGDDWSDHAALCSE